jgi:hypothetical protein
VRHARRRVPRGKFGCFLDQSLEAGNGESKIATPPTYQPLTNSPTAAAAQEFFNCADIAIAGSGAEFAVKSGRRLKLA